LQSDILSISRWIAEQALEHDEVVRLVDGLCARLSAAGLPLWRAHVSMPTLHPTIEGFGYTWKRGVGIEDQAWGWDNDPAAWHRSPFYHMLSRRESRLRRRLDGNDARIDFPILSDMAAAGATDYQAMLVAFGEPWERDFDHDPLPGVAVSFASDRPGGFSDDDLEMLEGVLPFLGLAVYRLTLQHVTVSTLDAYIGPSATKRVMKGEIRRGSVTRKPAVVFFSDLRGFTRLSDVIAGETLVAHLNEHFDCMVGPVERHGGQVLKFLGDGMLAVFALADGDATAACRRALDAAREAVAETDALNARRRAAGLPEMELDVALHTGEVMYGNVGAAHRLDFTMIGPAVNHASRIESLCEPLGRHVLASRSFAHACGIELVPLGTHVLRGVAEPQELFGLP
jgi:adenylate cyclase